MNSEQAFEKQIEMYQQMTGEERLAIGFACMSFRATSRGKGFGINILTPASRR